MPQSEENESYRSRGNFWLRRDDVTFKVARPTKNICTSAPGPEAKSLGFDLHGRRMPEVSKVYLAIGVPSCYFFMQGVCRFQILICM